MIFVLIFSIILTPYEIAFGADREGNDAETNFEKLMDKIFDVLFFIDIVLTFKAAFVTDDYEIIDDKKDIANNYLKGWFTADVLSCIPYGELGKLVFSNNASEVTKI
jgi:hypothetical protein